jgi:diphthamide synthase (EF-2-diphthine--ammonia ligase)
MKRTLLSRSSGKDSAWSLHLLRQQGEYEISGLLTTFNREANRVAISSTDGTTRIRRAV